MLFKNFVKAATILTEIVIAVVILIAMSLFAVEPTNTLILTNILLLLLILIQLFVASILIHIHDKLEGGRRK